MHGYKMENIDFTQTVSGDTINYLGAVGILIISTILVLLFVFIKRYKARFIPFLLGILAYALFVGLGYNLIVTLIFSAPGVQDAYSDNPTVLTGVFLLVFVAMYSAARIIIGRKMFDNYDHPGDVFIFGLGLGMCDALLYTFSSISLVIWANGINSAGMTELFKDFSEADMVSTYNSISMLFTSPSILWILLCVSAIFDILLNCGLAVLVYGVVKQKLPTWWFAVSAFINFVVVLPFKYYNTASEIGVILPFVIKTVLFAAAMYVIYKVDANDIGGLISYTNKDIPLRKKEFRLPGFGRSRNR